MVYQSSIMGVSGIAGGIRGWVSCGLAGKYNEGEWYSREV